MDRYSDLDTVRDRVWQRMERAAKDSDSHFRILTFGTAQDDQPHLRSVVLRAAARGNRRLSFHSDRRAEKIDDIGTHDRIAWHGWDPDTSEQIRLQGRATVHTDDAVADEMWVAQDLSAFALHP